MIPQSLQNLLRRIFPRAGRGLASVNRANTPKRCRHPQLETLESRQLLVADAFEPNHGATAEPGSFAEDITFVRNLLPGWAYSSNLGEVSGFRRFRNLTVDERDWYRIETTGTGTDQNFVRIDFVNSDSNANKDLDLDLFNGSSPTPIRTSRLTSLSQVNNIELISLEDLPAGEYFIKAYGKAGATNSNYTMTIDTPRSPEVTVSDDGLNVFTPRRETFDYGLAAQGSAGPIKTFRVGNEGGASLQTNNLVIPAGFTLLDPLAATIAPGQFDTFSVQLDTTAPGIHFGHVTFNTNDADESNIRFALEGTITPTTAIDQGDVFEENDDMATAAAAPVGAPNSPNFGFITHTKLIQHLVMDDAADWYRVQTTTTGTSHDLARIDFDTTLGDLDLQLYSSGGTLLATSQSSDLNFEIVTFAGRAAGTYFIRAYGFNGATNPDYDLTLAAPGNGDDDPDDFFEPNETFDQTDMHPAAGDNSPNLGTLVEQKVMTGLKLEDTQDVFRFQFAAQGTPVVRIDFDHLQGDLDLELWRYNHVTGGIDFVAGPDFPSFFDDDFEQISRSGGAPRVLNAGTYYAVITGANGDANVNYTLTITPPAVDRTLDIEINPPTNIFEGDGSGATSGTVTRTGALGAELYVKLHSSDITEARVYSFDPVTGQRRYDEVTIAPGAASANVFIEAIDDNRFDEAKAVNITASISGYASANAFVTVVPDIIPPVVANLGPDLDFTENGPAQLAADQATVSDVNSPNFNFGSLNVRFVSGGEVGDQLTITDNGTVSVQGTNVLVNSVVVGVLEGGTDGVALTVNFNGNANAGVAQEVLRAVSYIHTSERPSPDPKELGVQVADGDGGISLLVSKFINVTPVNDAPSLNIALNPKLPAVAEDSLSPPGVLISSLLKGAVTDPDRGGKQGIAIVDVDLTNGIWQYSKDNGATWRGIAARSETSAKVLPAWYRLRFVPNADFNGKTTVSYHAWDQSLYAAESNVDLTGKLGGTNPFSVEVDTAVHFISPVNDAPVLNTALSPTLGSVEEEAKNPPPTTVWKLIEGAITDIDAHSKKGIAIVGATQNQGTWQYLLKGTVLWKPMGEVFESSALLLPPDAQVRFLPKLNFNGTVTLTYRAWDQTSAQVAGDKANIFNINGGTTPYSIAKETVSLTVTPVNDAPTLTLGATVGYAADTPPIALASGGTVTDVDTNNFDGGMLRVRMGIGAGSTNRLMVAGAFTVDTNNDIFLGTTKVGTRVSNGFGTNELVITLNANATKATVQNLLRSIYFKTVGGTAGTRTALFSLSDGAGGLSPEVSKTIDIT